MLLSRFESGEIDVVAERDVMLGSLRARRCGAREVPAVLLLHGVHADGIDEPRLMRFARLLAGAGVSVTTPEIAALREMRFDRSAVVEIDRAAHALAQIE